MPNNSGASEPVVVSFLLAAIAFVAVAACTDGEDKDPAHDDTGLDTEDTDTDTADSAVDDTADSGETGDTEPPTEATLAIQLEVDVGGLYANSTDGDARPISGSHSAEDLVLAYVDPGSWWVTAYGPDMVACNISEVVELAAGDRFDWTVTELPGTMTEESGCVLPE